MAGTGTGTMITVVGATVTILALHHAYGLARAIGTETKTEKGKGTGKTRATTDGKRLTHAHPEDAPDRALDSAPRAFSILTATYHPPVTEADLLGDASGHRIGSMTTCHASLRSTDTYRVQAEIERVTPRIGTSKGAETIEILTTIAGQVTVDGEVGVGKLGFLIIRV